MEGREMHVVAQAQAERVVHAAALVGRRGKRQLSCERAYRWSGYKWQPGKDVAGAPKPVLVVPGFGASDPAENQHA
jgi:hypothetical protein